LYRPWMSSYGMRVGYDAEMSCTASRVPEQRSCERMSVGENSCGASLRLGLRQRMKCACVTPRSVMRESRSLMKRRPTELNDAFFFLPDASGLNSAASSAFDDAERAASKSGWSVSLFLSMKPLDM